MKLALEGGDLIESVHETRRAPCSFQPRARRGEALRAWPPARLLRAMEQLAEATLEMRRNAPLGRGDRSTHRCSRLRSMPVKGLTSGALMRLA